MNIKQIDNFLELWDKNKLEELWKQLSSQSHADIAFIIAWMTTTIRDDGEVRLSQWIVWLETKSKNQ